MTTPGEIDKHFPADAVSATTRRQYVRQLLKWISISGAGNIRDVISAPEVMFQLLDREPLSEHAKKLMIASVCSLLKHSDDLGSKYCAQKLKWSAKLKSMNELHFERSSTMQATPREIVNWVEWKDVLRKERELATYEFGSDRHLLLALYCLIDPIRADFGNVRVAIDKRIGRRYDEKKYNHIYLTSTAGKSFLVLHEYKTSKTYGRFARYLPDELARIIASNMQNNPREWLIIDTHGNPYDKRNSFTKYVNRVLEELFNKKFTIRMLRHSRISSVDYNEATPREIIKLSKNMHHSVGMQQLYRRKIPDLSVTLDEDTQQSHPQPTPRGQPTERTDARADRIETVIDQPTNAETSPEVEHERRKKKKKKKKKHKKKSEKMLLKSLAEFEPGTDRTVII